MKCWFLFLLCCAAALPVLAARPSDHVAGGVDGKGSDANFNQLGGIVVDSHGNILVSDTGDQTIRKITPDGVVTTFAGNAGCQGATDGEGSKARFSSPGGLAIDPNDNIYVADSGNSRIRKITPRRVVTTFAGMIKAHYRPASSTEIDVERSIPVVVTEDGPINTATFANPTELAFDKGGNLYVVDGNIRKIGVAGLVTTIAISTGATEVAVDGDISRPPKIGTAHATGIAVDGEGTVYVSDDNRDNGAIFKLSANGVSTVLARNSQAGSEALSCPSHVHISPDGDILAFGHGSVLKVSPRGMVTILAGSFKEGHPHIREGVGKEATLFGTGKLASDSEGNIYVANQYLVAKVSPAGVATFLAGSPSRIFSADGKGKEARFQNPQGIAIDKSGIIYISDSGNEIVRKITPDGVVTTFAGTPDEEGFVDGPGKKAMFSDPLGLTFDANGNLLVADSRNDAIRKITPDGMVTTLVKNAIGRGPYTFPSAYYGPKGLAVGPDGKLYVTACNAVVRFDKAGQRTIFAGVLDEDIEGIADGVGSAARLNDPTALVFDRTGNLYVADTNNAVIRKITPQGNVTTYAGKPGQCGAVDGARNEALFSHLGGVAIGPNRALYVADWDNKAIRRISPNGSVSTFAGTIDPSNRKDGRVVVAGDSFNPNDLAFDQHGDLLVTDYSDCAIVKITPDRTITSLAGGVRGD